MMVSKESIKRIIRQAKLNSNNGTPFEGDYIVMVDNRVVVITDIIKSYLDGNINMNQTANIAYTRVNG